MIEKRLAIALLYGEISASTLRARGVRPEMFSEQIPAILYLGATAAETSGLTTKEAILVQAENIARRIGVDFAACDAISYIGQDTPTIPLESAISAIIERNVISEIERVCSVASSKVRSGADISIAIQDAIRELNSILGNGITKSSIVPITSIDPKPLDSTSMIKTPFASINRNIGGIMRRQITLICAETGFGKTAFALNICTYASIILKLSVLYIDMELTPEIMTQRLISQTVFVPSDAWADENRLARFRDKLSVWEERVKPRLTNFNVVSSGPKGVSEIRAIIELAISHGQKPDIVVVDTFNKISRRLGVDQIVHEQDAIIELSRIAHDYDVALVCVTQPSKSDAKTGEIDVYSVRGSAAIVESAKLVVSIYGDRTERRKKRVTDEVIAVTKCTYGREFEFDALYLGPYYRHIENDEENMSKFASQISELINNGQEKE